MIHNLIMSFHFFMQVKTFFAVLTKKSGFHLKIASLLTMTITIVVHTALTLETVLTTKILTFNFLP